MPKTYQKLLEILKQPISESTVKSVNLIENFFTPSSDKNFEVAWGLQFIEDLQELELNSKLKEYITVFYKETLGYFLTGSSYGKYSYVYFNQDSVNEYTEQIKTLSPWQEKTLDRVSAHLWELAGDRNSQVRVSALYAILSNPLYLIKNSERISSTLVLSKLHKNHLHVASFLIDAVPQLLPEAVAYVQRQNVRSCQGIFKQNRL